MRTKEITLNPGEDGRVSFSFTPTEARLHSVSINGLIGSFEVIPPEFTTLSGAVRIKGTPYGIVGVLATLNGLSTYTGEQPPGYPPGYAFENLTPGTYTISFSKEGYETLTQEITLALGTNEFDVYLTPIPPVLPATLEGIVTDAQTGLGLYDVNITLHEVQPFCADLPDGLVRPQCMAGPVLYADWTSGPQEWPGKPAGEYEIKNIPAGLYTAHFARGYHPDEPYYESQTYIVALVEGQTYPLNVALERK